MKKSERVRPLRGEYDLFFECPLWLMRFLDRKGDLIEVRDLDKDWLVERNRGGLRPMGVCHVSSTANDGGV